VPTDPVSAATARRSGSTSIPRMPLNVSAAAARRFLVRRHLLAPARSLPADPESVMAVFERLGSVQFDPLGVAGRNHDLVLHARVADYDPAWTDHLLYERRALFETYNKMLSLLPTSELPWFRHSWDRLGGIHADGAFVRHGETVEHVLALIRERGPMSTLDFERRPLVGWYWGPTNEVRAALEALSEAGVVGLARREGNRRYFDLTERLYPPALLELRPSVREQVRHKLLSRYRANGLLGESGEYTLWYGTGRGRRTADDPPDALIRSELRDELVAAGELVPVTVEGVRGTRFVVASEVPLLEAAVTEVETGSEFDGATVAFVAPLDSFAWDRELLRRLFDFDYVWEVYVPAAKRRWGYYVLPILYGDRFVGRFEPRIERSENRLRVIAAWWEPGFDPRRDPRFVRAMRDALAAYLRFGRVASIDWAPALSPERRLFGVRPRGA
jgi:uncharacterized protein